MKVQTEATITPKMMAEAFWDMGSDGQTEFYESLYDVIKEDHKTNSSAYSLGELQWVYLADEIDKNPKAKEMVCALFASCYLRATDWLSKVPRC